jgi:hypothetical protein
MKIKLVRSLILASVTLVAGAGAGFAAEPAKEDAVVSAKLFAALEKSDYDAFIADGNAPFQEMKKEQFAAVTAQLAPRFHSGYTVSYLGELKQKGYHVTLWKVSFKNGSDDALSTLSTKDGKVGGFIIR